MATNIDDNKPRVMIVGAGLGGVTLALLLERANIPYALFERATQVKPLGKIMDLSHKRLCKQPMNHTHRHSHPNRHCLND